MIPFRFHNPTKVIFGPGKLSVLGNETIAMGRCALLVTGKGHTKKTGVLDRAKESLEMAGVRVVEFSGVDPNPRIESARLAAKVLAKENCDVVVALGGGSVMDIAKVIAATPFYKDDPWEMISHGQAHYRPPHRALPIITVPTLAATGSEMNSGAVVTNPETKDKCFVRAQCLNPAVAVIDPLLTTTVPPEGTVNGAVDTMVHVLESYFNGAEDTPLQDRMQEGVVLTVLQELPKVLDHPDDISARSNLQWASVVALNGWAQAGVNGAYPVHIIEHALSGHFDVAHGAGLAVLILGWMKVAYKHRPHKYVQLAQRVFDVKASGPHDLNAAMEGITKLESVLRSVNAPVRLPELGIGPDDFDLLVDWILRIYSTSNGRLSGIPALDREGLLRLLAICL